MADIRVPAELIDTAPESAAATFGNDLSRSAEYYRVLSGYSNLQTQFEETNAELIALRSSSEVARAKLIQPYAWAVLIFLSVYGGIVGALLVLQGFRLLGFHINDTVMGVVVGSTAVSAIGLVHTVVRGLFPVGQ